jgi:hypothetical protein
MEIILALVLFALITPTLLLPIHNYSLAKSTCKLACTQSLQAAEVFTRFEESLLTSSSLYANLLEKKVYIESPKPGWEVHATVEQEVSTCQLIKVEITSQQKQSFTYWITTHAP